MTHAISSSLALLPRWGELYTLVSNQDVLERKLLCYYLERLSFAYHDERKWLELVNSFPIDLVRG
jgi:hypothetical protein